MARSDLLVSLVRASAAGDRSTIASTVEAIVAEERARMVTLTIPKAINMSAR